MDTASLLIRYVCPEPCRDNEPVEVFYQSDECHKCSMLKWDTVISSNSSETLMVQTNFPTTLQFVKKNVELCSLRHQFFEGADYKFVVSTIDGCSDIVETSYDHNAFLPILFAFLIFGALAILYVIGKWIFKRYRQTITHFVSYQHFVHSDLGTPSNINNSSASIPQTATGDSPAAAPSKLRLRSLDTFRGISLTVMIFVNYGGGGYWFFNHSAWDGLTVADLLFPWFVWIMGVAIAFAFRGPLTRGESKLKLIFKVVKRTIILFTFGLIINTDGCKPTSLDKLRIMGVLQRLGLSYFFVAILEILFGKRAMKLLQPNDSSFRSFLNFFWDIIGSAPQWFFILSLVALHTCITFLLPVPGCPTGYLGPGGLHLNSSYYNCTGGAAQYVDRMVFGEDHMYQWPTCKSVYQTDIPFDPEGLLGLLNSIVMCYLGLHAGRILTLYPTAAGRLGRWVNWAIVWGLIAGLLCNFSQFDGVIPVNKNLWSLSFILSLSSMALILLSALYVICDVLHFWSGAPFIYPGMNSIVVYMCHEILNNVFPVSFAVDNTHVQQLAMNLWGPTLWTIMAAFMYYNDIFIAI